MIRLAIVLAFILAAAAARAGPLPETTIRQGMAAWQVPGLAIAVVRRGAPATIGAFGLRDVERNLAVTPRTLFATGSITKSFTVLGLAMLAEDGRLEWDTPVVRLAPGFRLHTDALTGAVTLGHMVSHMTGMPRHDALWYLGVFGPAELTARLRYLKPAAPLGTKFAYNNLMFATAGRLAGRLNGTEWRIFTQARILNPLGMHRAVLSLAAFEAMGDRAAAYFPGDKGRLRIKPRDTDAIAPAAALYADVADMARYVRFLLGDGRLGPRRLISAAAARLIRTPRTIIPDPPRFNETGRLHYAMGFYVTTYRGRRLIYHPGVIDGYGGMISFMPREGLGAIVLTNLSGRNPVPSMVTFAAYDRLLGLAPLPWPARFGKRSATASPGPLTPSPETPPRPVAAYEGVYRNPAYGRMKLRANDAGDGLRGTLHHIRFDLVHGGGDSWLVRETAWPLRRGLAMRFHFDGAVASRLTTKLADGPTYRLQAGDIAFERIPTHTKLR